MAEGKPGERFWYGHASQRLRERYGEDLSFEEYRALCLAVADPKSSGAYLTEKGRNGKGDWWMVPFRGRMITVGWHAKLRLIMTVTPPRGEF